jgi:hypothetical protein
MSYRSPTEKYEVLKIRKMIFLKFVLNNFEAAEDIYLMTLYFAVVSYVCVRVGFITYSSTLDRIYSV